MRLDMRGSHLCAIVSIIALCSYSAGAADDSPTLDFLEFLSDWQDTDGEILEPQMFDDDHTVPMKPDPEVTDGHE